MSTGVPVRTTVVWIALMSATALTWWLGTGATPARQGLHLMVAAAVVVAFLKIYFIGNEFMELRGAPAALRAAFTLWVVGIGSAITALYLV